MHNDFVRMDDYKARFGRELKRKKCDLAKVKQFCGCSDGANLKVQDLASEASSSSLETLPNDDIEGHDVPQDTLISRQFLCQIDQKLTCDCKHDWCDEFYSLGLKVYPTFKNLNQALKSFFDVKFS